MSFVNDLSEVAKEYGLELTSNQISAFNRYYEFIVEWNETIGHQSLVRRGLELVDEIVISIGINDKKLTYFSLEKRMEAIWNLYKDNPRVKVMSYNQLTVDFAKEVGAGFILRGIRTVNDFEYEKTIADVNRKLTGIETFILFTEPEHTHISSSIVRELLRYGKDISQFVPKETRLY